MVTLSFLLISTAIVIAFLTRARFDTQASASYSTSVQSELLAAGAVDHVISQFVNEVADSDNSTAYPLGDLTWFEPVRQSDMYPSMLPEAQTLLSPPPAGLRNTLVKQSIDRSFYTGGPSIPASSVNSASKNGARGNRPVSAKRWDLPQLLQNSDGTSGEEFADGTTTPSWIYVKENGEATTSPSSTGNFGIAGRYAYNVYDVGGLLNLNVAGYDTDAKDDAALKGSTVFADLTAIPGLTGTAVKNLIAWRAPYVSWHMTGNPSGPIQNGTYSVLDYLRMGAGVGWMKNPSLDSTGNQFFSRRDLLKYAQVEGFETALPFLTHFSVDLDAPTFSPPVNPADTTRLMLPLQPGMTIIDGKSSGSLGDLRGKETQINPPRFAEDHVISLQSGDKKANLPVLRQRFPLSRLALVATDPSERSTAKSNNDLTRRYFGLIPENDFTWRYEDADGGSGRIKRFSEITDRDPNFFEILKGVIHVGSLGQHKQRRTSTERVERVTEPFANQIDDHILRIGAAIIDQADADNYPTRIKLDNSNLGEIYGVEDLPYVYFMRFVAYCKPGSNASQSSGRVVLAQPSLWNPHNPERRNADSPTPTEFEFTANPINGGMLVLGTGRLGSGGGANLVTTQPESTPMRFNWDPTATTNDNFRQPQGLLSATYPQGLTGPTHPIAGSLENAPFLIGPRPYSGGVAIGFRVAESTNNNPITGDDGDIKFYGNPILFELKYKVGGAAYTYDRIWVCPEGIQPSDHRAGENHAYDQHRTFRSLFPARIDPNRNDGGVRSDAIYLKTDPRSHRFIWPSDMARFTGSRPGAPFRYTLAEGTGPGFYGGVYNNLMLDGQRVEDRLPIHWTYNVHPSQGNTEGGLGQGVDREYRRDVGILSVNRADLAQTMFYRDPDRVNRRAMGGADNQKSKVQQVISNPGPILGQQNTNVLTNYAAGTADTKAMPLEATPFLRPDFTTTLSPNTFYGNRPVVLNRPFRSVGELAHAFRDVPWKNIDLSFPESGDTGLLDVFTIQEIETSETGEPLMAGKVNLNSAPIPVLRALVNGVAKQLPAGSQAKVDLGNFEELVQRFRNYRATEGSVSDTASGSNGPLRSLAEIVSRVYNGGNGSTAKFVGLRPEAFGGDGAFFDKAIQERLTTAARALADAGTTRTWNLMIDVVTQAGRISDGRPLEDFNTSSEARYWVFVSIDRFTGRVLARSVERVVE